ncbi:amino acid/polyamine/organocation transporter (APC superfamily) [Isoptericola sp. CG 20/1183]|uniref:Amino acid/polyamine/organocation transporter (APC superfamily) n=1 Tax=Isoptericola halotolerans TaxID=300560 RepID=A0ABX5EDF2_9MICO|nr:MULTISPECIES: APC family permease [Isoptericola]MCK0115910.1 APC family permease [Isoptericola sp. S6320L]PRZ02555.1 amino acid/polyamine/organocation transporter (APC superfamily) [Isoptericola sp. CG 20/1183]PRZ02836.1 amino acid/polyamine/organocation transporter (APC superfamily) [Isoptericola halotolerans]
MNAPDAPPAPGLRAGVVSRLDSSVFGIASTAPAYSLAVTVGVLAAAVGTASPTALLLSAVPVVLVALCFRELNRAQPDCGTAYSWAQRALGPRTGALSGWLTITACLLVMANLALVTAVYAFELLGAETLADSPLARAAVGSVGIVVMAWLAYRGVQLAARLQAVLVVIEVVALLWFAARALAEAERITWPTLQATGTGGVDGWSAAFLAAVFLYWGWDSSFSTNEESDDPRETPGVAALAANGVLVVLYVVVTWAAITWAGTDRLADVADDDFFAVLAGDLMGTTGGTVLVAAVLVSGLASAQTTVLPTTRTLLAMGRDGVGSSRLAGISRHGTPSTATWVFTVASVGLYVLLVCTSEAVLWDSVAATAVLVSGYYLVTAVAALRYPYADGVRARPLWRLVVPGLAAVVFAGVLVVSLFDLSAVSLGVVALSLALGAPLLRARRTAPIQSPHPTPQETRP